MSRLFEKLSSSHSEALLGSVVISGIISFVALLLGSDDWKGRGLVFAGIVFIVTCILIALVLVINHAVLEHAMKKHSYKSRFCGFWMNERVNDPNLYGVYRILFEDRQLKIDGRVYNAATKNYVSEWQSVHVVVSDQPDNLHYFYYGKTVRDDDMPNKSRSYGVCYLEFHRFATEYEAGIGYFVDDRDDEDGTKQQWKQRTKFQKINKELCDQAGVSNVDDCLATGKMGWDKRKKMIDSYHGKKTDVSRQA